MYTAAAHAVRCSADSPHKEHVRWAERAGGAQRPGLDSSRRNLLHNGNVRADGGKCSFHPVKKTQAWFCIQEVSLCKTETFGKVQLEEH